jgi:hypothetical protein
MAAVSYAPSWVTTSRLRLIGNGNFPFPTAQSLPRFTATRSRRKRTTKVLAKGFPGAGVQSFIPGSGVNMQFMVKDSKKYAATGGWGFGDFTNGKPGNEALMKTCFNCNVPAKDHDFVFTHYAP